MNPILQALNGKNNMFNQISNINQMINGNPQGVYNQMMQNNPQFRDFVNANKGKTPEQIAQENGIDINLINQFR